MQTGQIESQSQPQYWVFVQSAINGAPQVTLQVAPPPAALQLVIVLGVGLGVELELVKLKVRNASGGLPTSSP